MENEENQLEVLVKPLVIEFTGTPNGGKDTQIHILADYLRDYRGLRVSIIDELYESSRVYPAYEDKLFWMVGSTIKNLIEIKNDKTSDIVLLNRGLFDILVILELYYRQGQVNKKKLASLSSSLSTKILCNIVDIIILLKITPEISMKRERVYPRNSVVGLAEKLDEWNPNPESTLTNHDGLKIINDCYNKIYQKHENTFKNIFFIDDKENKNIDEIAIRIGKYINPFLPENKNTFQKELLLKHKKTNHQTNQLSFSDYINDFGQIN